MHVLSECEAIHENDTTKVKVEQLFTENVDTLKQITIKIDKIMTRLSESAMHTNA